MAITERSRDRRPVVASRSRCATRCTYRRALLRPRVLRAREGAPLAAGVADGVPAGGDPGAGRLRRVRDLRPIDPRRPPARPSRSRRSTTRAGTGRRSCARVPVALPAARSSARSTAGGGTSTAPTRSCTAPRGSRPSACDPDDLRLQECMVDTWGACVWINMDPDARPLREALSPGAAAPRRGRRREHARVVVEGDDRQRQLEDGPGGVPRGLPRDGNPPAAHVRYWARTTRSTTSSTPRSRTVTPASRRGSTRRRAACRRGVAPTSSSSGRGRSGRARTR